MQPQSSHTIKQTCLDCIENSNVFSLILDKVQSERQHTVLIVLFWWNFTKRKRKSTFYNSLPYQPYLVTNTFCYKHIVFSSFTATVCMLLFSNLAKILKSVTCNVSQCNMHFNSNSLCNKIYCIIWFVFKTKFFVK